MGFRWWAWDIAYEVPLELSVCDGSVSLVKGARGCGCPTGSVNFRLTGYIRYVHCDLLLENMLIKQCNCLCVGNPIGGAVSTSVGKGRPELSGDTF